MLRFIALAAAATAVIGASPASAQDAPAASRVAMLVHRDRVLRERIGQLELDALVARMAKGDAASRRPPAKVGADRQAERELALYSL